MKRLALVLAVALGLALAQSSYVGGHVGFFGGSGLNIFNAGAHGGVRLGVGLPEVRAGVDFSSVLGVLILGVNADLLVPLAAPGLPASPYVGLGGNVWFLPGGSTDFGLHGTLGVRAPLPGMPLNGFVEFQPTYAFGGGGGFVYYLKLGFNYGF